MLALPSDDPNRVYHDHHYGFPISDDNELFGRFILEINQAGLSWSTILKKEMGFRQAYDDFSIDRISTYNEAERQRLLNDKNIIRNRLKIDAAIENAQRIVALRSRFNSFKGWLDTHHPLSRDAWTALFKQTFKFTGGEIVNEFLMSTGYLPGAHITTCPIHQQIISQKPKWLEF